MSKLPMRGNTQTTRREMLGALGAGGVAATAGCLTVLPSFGQRVRYGEVNDPAPDGATYRRWLPAGTGAGVRYHVPGERGEATLGGPIEDQNISNHMEYVGVALSDVEYVCRVDDVFVLRTDPDRNHVEQVLGDLEYEYTDTYRGFERYERSGRRGIGLNRASVGVGDDVVLYTSDDVEALEPIIEAGTEESSRVYTQREQIGELFEKIGAHPVTNVGYPDVGGRDGPIVTFADQYVVEDDTAYALRTRLYADEGDISRGELESEIESNSDALDATRVDLRIDEPFVTIAVELDPDTFLDHFGPATDFPLVNWHFTYDEDAEELRLVHLAGEEVDPDRLEIQGEGLGTELPQFEDEYQTVSPGDSLVFDVAGHEDWAVGLAVVDQMTGETHPLFFRQDPETERQNSE